MAEGEPAVRQIQIDTDDDKIAERKPALTVGEWGIIIGGLDAHIQNYEHQKRIGAELTGDQLEFFERVILLAAKLHREMLCDG